MTFVGDESTLPRSTIQKISEELHEENEKAEIIIKPIVESPCLLCGKSVRFFNCPCILTITETQKKHVLCKKCLKFLMLFKNSGKS
ncbi:MAG: hypothetical protein V1915_01970 [Candidatus Bathyarchaeota archaeon]